MKINRDATFIISATFLGYLLWDYLRSGHSNHWFHNTIFRRQQFGRRSFVSLESQELLRD